jgi:hypothetical protein
VSYFDYLASRGAGVMTRLPALAAAFSVAAVLAVAGCGTASVTPAPATRAPLPASVTPAAPPVPVLRPGGTVSFADPVPAGTQGAVVTEHETWKLTSASYISYAAAMAGGVDADVPANLGASSLRPGDRYLVLGLTITAGGPDGFVNTDWTISSASYSWAEAGGNTGATADYCLGQAPPGDTQLDPQFISSMCVINALRPGQRISGYLFLEVPGAPAAVTVFETEPETPLVVIDPDGICRGPAVCG